MTSSLLIGQLALEHGLITPEHLRAALAVKARRPEAPLGSLLVEAGCLDQATLRVLLGVQLRRTAEAMALRSLQRRAVAGAAGGRAAGECAAGGVEDGRARMAAAVIGAGTEGPGDRAAEAPCGAVETGRESAGAGLPPGDALAAWGLRLRALGTLFVTALFVALVISAHRREGEPGHDARAAVRAQAVANRVR